MNTLMIIVTVVICLLIIALTSLWSIGRNNVLNEREQELDKKEHDLKNKEFEINTREDMLDFRERNTKEVSAKYTITQADYNRPNYMKAVRSRMSQQLGWNIIKAFGDPEPYINEDGNDVYAVKFKVTKI